MCVNYVTVYQMDYNRVLELYSQFKFLKLLYSAQVLKSFAANDLVCLYISVSFPQSTGRPVEQAAVTAS